MAQTDRRIPARRVVAFLKTVVSSLLEALGADPPLAAEDLVVLPAEESERLRAFNQTATLFPERLRLHELFEEQVARMPGAVAVEYEGERISYADLDERANRPARHLKACRVGRDRIVAVHLERGVDLIVSAVAALKAGGACMPLDLNHPPERLAFMLNDSKPSVISTQARLRARLPDVDVPILAVDTLPPAPATKPDAGTETSPHGSRLRSLHPPAPPAC